MLAIYFVLHLIQGYYIDIIYNITNIIENNTYIRAINECKKKAAVTTYSN